MPGWGLRYTDGTGAESAFKRERLHHAGLGWPWEAETSSVKHIPPLLHQGTFNPLFDGRPRKYFFHILNLLAPVNHLNLLPLRTHTPMSFPSLAAVKDAATLFVPAFAGERTAFNYETSKLSPRWDSSNPHLVLKHLRSDCPKSHFGGGCTWCSSPFPGAVSGLCCSVHGLFDITSAL